RPVLVLPGARRGGDAAGAPVPAHAPEGAARRAHARLVPAEEVLRRVRVPAHAQRRAGDLVVIADGIRLVGPPGSNKVMAGELSRLVGRGMPGTRLAEPRKA